MPADPPETNSHNISWSHGIRSRIFRNMCFFALEGLQNSKMSHSSIDNAIYKRGCQNLPEIRHKINHWNTLKHTQEKATTNKLNKVCQCQKNGLPRGSHLGGKKLYVSFLVASWRQDGSTMQKTLGAPPSRRSQETPKRPKTSPKTPQELIFLFFL